MNLPPAVAAGLRQTLEQRLHGRIVVMGIGNPVRGDDGVGCAVVQRLRELLALRRQGGAQDARDPPLLTLIVAEEVPESWIGPAVAARPDVVLLVDAVDLGQPPGSVAVIPATRLGGATFATHRTPLSPLAHYLAASSGADVQLLGIQPANISIHAPVHPAVQAAARGLAVLLLEVLSGNGALDPSPPPPGPEATP